MKTKNKFIQLWLIIGIIAGFAAIVFFSITYLNNSLLCDVDCRIKNEVSLSLVLLSLVGMFAGSLTYYFISEKYEKQIDRMKKDISASYKFLDADQKKILKTLIELKGKTNQSVLAKKTGLSRVKISRQIKHMETKKIIEKTKNGMTNEIMLSEDLKELFLPENK